MNKLFAIFAFVLATVSALPTIHHGDIATVVAEPLIATGVKTVIQPETVHVQERTIAKVGELVHRIPSAVSERQSTVVHNQADLVTPILAPGIRTNTLHVVKAYTRPVVYATHGHTRVHAIPSIDVLH